MKKEKGELSLHLTEPTPSRLKSECMTVYSERFNEKDNKALRLFFQTKEDTADYSSSIRNIDTDKFKPLCNFLKGRTSDTDAKNIELLSWLIDFEPRPYDYKNKYDDLSGFVVKESDNEKDIGETDHEVDSKEIGSLAERINEEAREIETTADYEASNVSDESETESMYNEESFHSDSKNSGNSENANERQFLDSERYMCDDEIKIGADENDHGEAEQPPSPPGSKSKKILITSAVAASVLFGGYFFLNKKTDVESIKVENINQKQEDKIDSSEIQGDIKIIPKDTLSTTSIESEKRIGMGEPITKMADVPEAKCMYWNEDHYEKVFCNDENIIGKPIPINKELLESFRKITFPDTITLKSEGKIWYSKSEGKLEYFTRPGVHPVNNKPLRKLSDYIIKTHILKN
ncbi:hypothetical protein [Chryseobacterium kwangjuense]|uniref:hypothetical protein n=1 Tax=Chryseobacterium kwangjuense TaxID=267125 RepID=UPI001041F8C5|nr:hypothetical protein [Chryseobacterium kwangjuense]